MSHLSNESWTCTETKTRAFVWDASGDAVAQDLSKEHGRLIAAAPEMLAALKVIFETPTSDSTGVVNSRNRWTEWAKDRAYKAISRAEGRS